MIPAALRHCPECGGAWPKDDEHALRGCGWLSDLPRGVSPSNSDVEMHDDQHGRDRFLRLELKRPGERVSNGQMRYLIALSRQPNWTVRVVQGRPERLTLWKITSDGYAIGPATRTHVEALRRAIVSWLNGALWRDAEASLENDDKSAHVCGWVRAQGVWTCAQDHYAVGHAPETSCGRTLEFA